jgi:hypothetical protein
MSGGTGTAGTTTGAAGAPGTAGISASAGSTGAGGSAGTTGGGGGSIPTSCADAATVIANYCLDCHVTPPQIIYAGLDLQAPNVAQRLVGVPAYTGASGACAGRGNLLDRGTLPATGIFIDKINFTQSCGDGMPYMGSKMTDAEITCLQSWANGLVASVGK